MDKNVFDEIRARRLVIEDQNEKGRIILTTTPDGDPAIVLRDANGVMRLQLLILDGDEPKVLLTDRQGNGRLQLVVGGEDSASITMFHNNDNPWFFCSTDGYKHYVLCLFDREGEWKVNWSAQLEPQD